MTIDRRHKGVERYTVEHTQTAAHYKDGKPPYKIKGKGFITRHANKIQGCNSYSAEQRNRANKANKKHRIKKEHG